MRAKDYFDIVRAAEARLGALRARLEHYEDLGMMTGMSLSPTGGGSHGYSGSRVEAAAVGMIDATAEIQEQIRKLTIIHNKAQRVIDQIPTENYRLLLTYHYLSGWPLKRISEKLGYTDSNSIYRAKGWALKAAQEFIDKELQEDGRKRSNADARAREVERQGAGGGPDGLRQLRRVPRGPDELQGVQDETNT